MKNSILILLAIFIFLNQGCQERGAKMEGKKSEIISLKEIVVSKDFLSDQSNQLEIFTFETIDLERKGNPNISYINDIVFTQENLFLIDKNLGVLKFDKNGKFISQIGNKGEAPEEYQMAVAIHLTENKNHLMVADWSQMKIISYDLDGKFLGSTKIPGNPISFFASQDSVLVFQEDMVKSTKKDEQNIILSKVSLETLHSKDYQKPLFTWYSKFHRNYGFLNVLGNSNNQELFYLPRVLDGGLTNQNDTIYRKEKDQLNAEYLVRFSGFNKDEMLRIDHLEIVGDHANLFFKQPRQSYFLSLDLRNKKPLAYISKFLYQDLSFENFPKHVGNNLYYSVFKDESGTKEKNPSIVIYELKEMGAEAKSL